MVWNIAENYALTPCNLPVFYGHYFSPMLKHNECTSIATIKVLNRIHNEDSDKTEIFNHRPFVRWFILLINSLFSLLWLQQQWPLYGSEVRIRPLFQPRIKITFANNLHYKKRTTLVTQNEPYAHRTLGSKHPSTPTPVQNSSKNKTYDLLSEGTILYLPWHR